MNTCLCRYRGLTGRRAAPVLLIVYNRERDSAESAARFGDRIRSAAEGLPDMEELKTRLIDRSEIGMFDPKELVAQ